MYTYIQYMYLAKKLAIAQFNDRTVLADIAALASVHEVLVPERNKIYVYMYMYMYIYIYVYIHI